MGDKYDGLDEKQLARTVCGNDFSELMCDVVLSGTADIEEYLDDAKSKRLFNEKQRIDMKARMINRHVANLLKDDPRNREFAIDDSGFCHMTHIQTGLHLYYRALDLSSQHYPMGGRTLAAKARYTQGACLPASRIVRDILGVPDLSSINLMLVCDYSSMDSIFLRVYKLMDPGAGRVGGPSAYSFPLYPRGTCGAENDPSFIPEPQDGVDVLGPLLQEENAVV